MKQTFLAVATLCFAVCSGCTRSGSVTTWGNSTSYKQATGYEFNYGAAGFDGIPDIIIFCRVQVGNQPAPSFKYKWESTTPSSYTFTINGTSVAPSKGQFLFYVNDTNGEPKKIEIERSQAAEILKADHEGYIKFWNDNVEPKLKRS
jgi:hypothetical protein